MPPILPPMGRPDAVAALTTGRPDDEAERLQRAQMAQALGDQLQQVRGVSAEAPMKGAPTLTPAMDAPAPLVDPRPEERPLRGEDRVKVTEDARPSAMPPVQRPPLEALVGRTGVAGVPGTAPGRTGAAGVPTPPRNVAVVPPPPPQMPKAPDPMAMAALQALDQRRQLAAPGAAPALPGAQGVPGGPPPPNPVGAAQQPQQPTIPLAPGPAARPKLPAVGTVAPSPSVPRPTAADIERARTLARAMPALIARQQQRR